MSDDTDQTGEGDEAGPQLTITAQYIKDLSFENPNSPELLFELEQAPAIDIEIDTSGRGLGNDYFEVDLKLNATATYNEKTAFVIELTYSGVVHVDNVSEDQKGAFVLVEGPRQLFPFARQIVAQATTQSGFPPLLLNPVDFFALLRRKQQQQQQEEAAG